VHVLDQRHRVVAAHDLDAATERCPADLEPGR
jgi:hypothetical protein